MDIGFSICVYIYIYIYIYIIHTEMWLVMVIVLRSPQQATNKARAQVRIGSKNRSGAHGLLGEAIVK